MSVFDNHFGQRPLASLDSVTFDVSRYDCQGDRNGARVWFLPEGGGVGLYYFPRRPDISQRLTSVAPLRDFYSSQMGAKSRVIECRLLALDGVQSVWLIAKAPSDQGAGAVYLGSLTIPFRDFSFVIKIQCQEQGVTGVREALLIDEALKSGTGHIEGDQFIPDGWTFDDEEFDDRLPQHPLSRLRRELGHIASSVRIESKVRDRPRFDLTQNDT